MNDQAATVKKPARKRAPSPKRPGVSFKLPREFEALCEREGVGANELVRQFVADLCDLRAWVQRSAFAGSGPEAHQAAQAWLAVARRAWKDKAAGR